jgi:EAL domain-containing protein (putative c-di-GMP-specific phosphodiesterase class I)
MTGTRKTGSSSPCSARSSSRPTSRSSSGLKIGQDFIEAITSSLSNASVIAAITAMAHSFDLEVIIAEGIESARRLEFCRSVRCDAVQGFIYSRPVTAGEIEKLLEKQKDPAFRF